MVIAYEPGDSSLRCALCGGELPNILNEVIVCHTESGTVIVGRDRAVHKCDTVTKTDELDALIKAGKMLHGTEDIQDP